jgi:hypothetical protein
MGVTSRLQSLESADGAGHGPVGAEHLAGPLVEKPFTVQGILEKVEPVPRNGAPDA